MNNRKSFATPFHNGHVRVRATIPLYRSSQASSAAFAIARKIGVERITPATHMMIISSPLFYDLSNKESSHKEKLCSVQEYIEESEELYLQLHKWEVAGLSPIEISTQIDQEEFELIHLLIWLTYDNDAHAGNLRTFKKPNGLYGLKKIDNNLTFPEKNSDLNNCLSLFPNALQEASPMLLNLIETLPVRELIDELTLHGLESAIPPFLERITLLQTLIQTPHITIKEMNMQLDSGRIVGAT